MSVFSCPICLNKDPRFIGYINNRPYCRRCISFKGEKAQFIKRKASSSPIVLNYKLSEDQKRISDKVRENFKNGIDTLIYAVCGAGKTELVYGVIADALRSGKQVGFALPRKDVVIELFFRLKEAFPEDKVTAVYGGHHKELTGDIIILTTHQLYRYEHYFDLLIMDEIDAFPFKDNEVLDSFYRRSINGRVVLMSATPSKEILQRFQEKGRDIVELRTRFHKKPIPVPKVIIKPKLISLILLIRQLKEYLRKKKPCFIFAPTINECESLYSFLKRFVPNGEAVHSKKKDRAKIIDDFKHQKYSYLVTTSVLERGITVKDLQVIVFHADRREIYDSSTLIQISGRAGRKYDAPKGEVTFYSSKLTPGISTCLKEIKFCNTFL